MQQKAIESDIKNYKIREGPIYKRSKFLKEWRDRWLVLTHNFLYTFTSKKLDEVTDIIDLKEIKSYKSYLRKDEEMIPAGFKIRSADDMFYFCAKSCHEKWSWIVSLERLLDYKYVGASPYNNVEFIKTKGFESQMEFENGGKVQPQAPSMVRKQTEKTIEQVKKQVDDEAQKIMKQIQEQQKQLDKQKSQLEQKQANLLKQQKKREQEKKIEESKKKTAQKGAQSSTIDEQSGSKVAQLRNMFEKRMTVKDTIPDYNVKTEQKQSRKEDTIHLSRHKIVAGLFDQFRPQASQSFGFSYMMDFLINVAGDDRLGYQQFVVIQGKTHDNKKTFSEIFVQLLMIYQDYNRCENLMRFIQACIFQIPGLFNPQQISCIRKKLKDFFNVVEEEDKLCLILKNMFIIHKMSAYQKGQIFEKLDKLVKNVKKEETRNWAKKLRDDF